MLYLSSRDDLVEVVDLCARFRVELPTFVTPKLRAASHLQATPARPRRLPAGDGAHSLVFDSRTASWCYLSERELALWRRLRAGTSYRALSEAAEGWRSGELRAFFTHLYRRGLLAVDGKPGLDPKLYAGGPLFPRAYLIEILLTERCNLGCRYCYAHGSPNRATMSLHTLRRAVDLVMDLPCKFLTIQFAGGETLTRFRAFREAVTYIHEQARRAGKEPYVTVQSNGTLLTRPGVVEFLREFGIGIGVSLDGPADINDLTRTYAAGGSSYRETVRGIEAVREAGLEVVGALTVVARHNVGQVERLLDHFAELGLAGVRFNPILARGRGESAWADLGISPGEYAEFMKAVTGYIGRTRAFREANLERLVRNLVGRQRTFRCMRSPCGAGLDYLVITPEGDVYPCVHWLRESELCLGNVRHLDSLEWAFLHSPVVQEMANRVVARIPACRRCQWRHLCEGGCSLAARDRHGSLLAPTPLCEYYRVIYPFLLEYLAQDPELAGFLVPEAEVSRVNGSRPRGRRDPLRRAQPSLPTRG